MHAWRVEEREYARHEQRRGRRHAYETLAPTRTALVAVDLVPFFVEQNPYCRGILPNVQRLAFALREAGGTVAWVVPAGRASADFYGAEVAAAYAGASSCGSPRARLWQELEVAAGDLVVDKTAPSAFFPGRCDLPGMLAERDVDTVLVTGTTTDVCCESTVRDASTLGHRVVLVADEVLALLAQGSAA